jgi:hypothetical protein
MKLLLIEEGMMKTGEGKTGILAASRTRFNPQYKVYECIARS